MTLKNVFDQDYFSIDGKQYTDEDMKAMSFDDLETLKMLINKKISGLSTAIMEKKMDYANGGPGATRDWMKRHKNALSINWDQRGSRNEKDERSDRSSKQAF